jgi:hypothetical protein
MRLNRMHIPLADCRAERQSRLKIAGHVIGGHLAFVLGCNRAAIFAVEGLHLLAGRSRNVDAARDARRFQRSLL